MNDNWYALCISIFKNVTPEQAFGYLEGKFKLRRNFNPFITDEDMVRLMILDKNIKTGEDNSNDTIEVVKEKLTEEVGELLQAFESGDWLSIREETFDVMQTLLRVFKLMLKQGYDIRQLNKRHNKKLVNRGWKSMAILEILIKK